MISYNKVTLIGNLTHDPVLKELNSDGTLCCFSIAVNSKHKEKIETNYIDIDAWGELGKNCSQYLKKGRLVLVEGRLKLKKWKNSNQENCSRLIVVANLVQFLDRNEYEPMEIKDDTEENN